MWRAHLQLISPFVATKGTVAVPSNNKFPDLLSVYAYRPKTDDLLLVFMLLS